MGESIRSYFGERREIFQLLRDVKWLVIVSVLLALILAVPPQVRELYRIFVDDIAFAFNYGDARTIIVNLIRLVAPLVALSLIVWFGTYQVTTEHVQRVGNLPPATRQVAWWLPALCGSLPLFAVAIGQSLARPNRSDVEMLSELPAGPWDDFGRTVSSTLGSGLLIGCLSFFLIGIVVLACCLRAPERMRHWASRLNDSYFSSWRLLGLTLVPIVLIVVIFTLFPVALPRSLGAFGVLCVFALCLVIFSVHLSILTIRSHLPLIPCVLALALAFSLLDLNDNHTIRTLPNQGPLLLKRLSSGDAFRKWYQVRLPDIEHYDDFPIYVVAAQGGGIYAAYATALFLARMYDLCPAFNDHLFAISSVSGGSLGAATYAAASNWAFTRTNVPKARPSDVCPRITEYLKGEIPIPQKLSGEDPNPEQLEGKVRAMFRDEFLSPLIAASLFPDFAQRFLFVPIKALDRARALEIAFEGSESALDEDSQFLRENVRSVWTPERKAPALLINATDAGSGRRVVVAPFLIERSTPTTTKSAGALINFSDLGWHHEADWQFPPQIALSTAAVISARFPWVTPAATVPIGDDRLGPQTKIRLVDGGYVDNSGVETALDLIDSIQPVINELNSKADSQISSTGRAGRVSLRLIILSGAGYPVRSSFGVGEMLEPIRALLSTRGSRAYVAIGRAAERAKSRESKIQVGEAEVMVSSSDLGQASLNSRFYPLPLGWAISNPTRNIIEKQSGYFWGCEPDPNFVQTQKSLSQTDCIQLQIYHELNQSLDEAADEIGIVKLLSTPEWPERLSHNKLIKCYQGAKARRMNLPSSRALNAFLNMWDAHPEWSNEKALALMLGTVANESGDFRVRIEHFDFESPERIQAVWGRKHFPTIRDAVPFVRDPKALALKVHGVGFQGNTEPEDSWRYRGRGLALLEGRYEYERYGKALKIDLLGTPDLALNPVIGAHLALEAYFGNNFQSRVASYLNDEKSDWEGATSVLRRVAHKDGIIAKSKIFYACIEKSRKDAPTQASSVSLNQSGSLN